MTGGLYGIAGGPGGSGGSGGFGGIGGGGGGEGSGRSGPLAIASEVVACHPAALTIRPPVELEP